MTLRKAGRSVDLVAIANDTVAIASNALQIPLTAAASLRAQAEFNLYVYENNIVNNVVWDITESIRRVTERVLLYAYDSLIIRRNLMKHI